MPPPSPHTPAGVVQCLPICLDRFRALIALSFPDRGLRRCRRLAGPFEDAVAKFANDDFSDTDEAIGAVATSGNPLAFPIISALQDGRLSADPDTKKVFVTRADGKIIDAATGAAVDKLPDGAAAVRLNNRLRRTVEAALGGLTLLSPDPAKRIAAAQSVFKTPRGDRACRRSTARWPRKPTRPPRRPSPRPAPRSCCSSPTPPRSKSSKPSPSSRRAAIRKRWRC